MTKLNFDPRPPERRLESDPVEDELGAADKVAESLMAFGRVAMLIGVTVLLVILLASLVTLLFS